MNFIFDFETLGTNVLHCVPLRCSYLKFDWTRFTENPYVISELLKEIKTVKFDVKSLKIEHNPSDKDIQFWKETRPGILKPSETDVTGSEFMNGMIRYIGDDVIRWWTRDKAFDYSIMIRLSEGNERVLQKGYLPHWNGIDVQSWIQGKLDFNVHKELKVSNHHDKFDKFNSTYSVMLDVINLQHITQLENGIQPNDIDK